MKTTLTIPAADPPGSCVGRGKSLCLRALQLRPCRSQAKGQPWAGRREVPGASGALMSFKASPKMASMQVSWEGAVGLEMPAGQGPSTCQGLLGAAIERVSGRHLAHPGLEGGLRP